MDNLVFAGKVMINNARAGFGLFGDERDRRIE
jgi:hypothetical protein